MTSRLMPAGIRGLEARVTAQSRRMGMGETVTVVVSARQRAAAVTTTTTGMATLPAGRVCQLWVMDASGAHSAPLLSPTGQNGLVLASGVLPGDRIGMTVEPSGGTSRPTTTPVVILPPANRPQAGCAGL
jgi:hypothetical protein